MGYVPQYQGHSSENTSVLRLPAFEGSGLIPQQREAPSIHIKTKLWHMETEGEEAGDKGRVQTPCWMLCGLPHKSSLWPHEWGWLVSFYR